MSTEKGLAVTSSESFLKLRTICLIDIKSGKSLGDAAQGMLTDLAQLLFRTDIIP